MIVLAFDPSIATAGWAVLRAPPSGLWTRESVVAIGTIRTEPREAIGNRLMILFDRAGEVVTEYHPTSVVIEKPAYPGTYRRTAIRQRSGAKSGAVMNAEDMRLNAMASAVLFAGAALVGRATGLSVRERPASTARKSARHQLIASLIRGIETNEHERDALTLALLEAMDHRLKEHAA